MLQKREVIVLRTFRYGDNSLILKTFSREKGVFSLITAVSRNSKSGLKTSLFQPLNQLELVFYSRSKGDLKRLKEARLTYNYQSLPYQPVKTCIALFLAELLQHLLQEEEEHLALYRYLQEGLARLDNATRDYANFHLVFLMRICSLLGFAPQVIAAGSAPRYFNLAEGTYWNTEVPHRYYLSGRVLQNWRQLQDLKLENCHELALDHKGRNELLDALLEYIRLHVSDFKELRSLDVLRQILH